MRTRAGLAIAIAFGVGVLAMLGAPASSSGKAKSAMCTAGGRYIITGNPRGERQADAQERDDHAAQRHRVPQRGLSGDHRQPPAHEGQGG
jgi:hypothetical protein